MEDWRMRQIKFRGKDNDHWVYGDYTHGGLFNPETEDVTERHIISSDFLHDVDPDTIGQFTGMKDKKGVEIYDGDIIYVEFADKSCGYYLIGWNEEKLSLGVMDAYSYQSISEGYDFAEFKNHVLLAFLRDALVFYVKGNIHDNPELMNALNK